MNSCPILPSEPAFCLCERWIPWRRARNGHRAMNDFTLSSSNDFRRIPGLFRRWELAQVIDAGEDYHVEDAGMTSDGTTIFAIYRRAPDEVAAEEREAAR